MNSPSQSRTNELTVAVPNERTHSRSRERTHSQSQSRTNELTVAVALTECSAQALQVAQARLGQERIPGRAHRNRESGIRCKSVQREVVHRIGLEESLDAGRQAAISGRQA